MTYARKQIMRELKHYRDIIRRSSSKRLLDNYFQEANGFIWALYYVDAIDHSSWKRYNQYFFDLWYDTKDRFDYGGDNI